MLGKAQPFDENKYKRKSTLASTPESQESHMISLAMEVAEKQLREGTASSQVITHFLKLGTEQSRLERKKIEKEIALLDVKKQSIASSDRVETMYKEALDAFRSYSGQRGSDED